MKSWGLSFITEFLIILLLLEQLLQQLERKLVMNESNRLALKIAMEAINKPDVDGFENMWKTLWEHSTVTISKNTKGADA